jgi:hypothetical protein
VADDCMMKVFSVASDDVLNEESLIDLPDETFAIASNNVDKIAYGGSDKKVFIQKVEVDSEDAQNLKRSDASLAMAFDSNVSKVQFIGGKYLLALSEDSHAQMMNLETEKVTHF